MASAPVTHTDSHTITARSYQHLVQELIDITETPLPRLPPRSTHAHKGDYGRALLIGGSPRMSGAIALAGMAALRGGAGLVTLTVPRQIAAIVAGFEPSYMVHSLQDDASGQIAEGPWDLLDRASAVAIGPGLGRGVAAGRVVKQVYERVRQAMVVDADGLAVLGRRSRTLARPGGPRILTPHPGEFARLTGDPPPPADDVASRAEAAAQLAARDVAATTVVVLKGRHTVITDGSRFAINQTGNPGMATGGSGDVLTGLITALLCQQLPAFDASRLAVHLHGLAGDAAAAQVGEVSLIASDLVSSLPCAFSQLSKSP